MSHSDPQHDAVPPRAHGGIDPAELSRLGIDPATVLDVSSSVNPYGPAPSVERAIRTAPVDVYPDPTCAAARAALARACGVDPRRVVLGNGATDLLWTAARVLLAPKDAIVLCEPSFSELRAAAVFAGGRLLSCRGVERQRFRRDPADAVRMARRSGARVVGLCQPTSPTGDLIRAEQLGRLAALHGDVTFVLDQSFLALSTHPEDRAFALPDNVVCVRSLTKEHAIPGVRVGYLIAEAELAARIERSRAAWTVGSAAQAAAIATVAVEDFIAESRARLLSDAAALEGQLRALGYPVLPSQTTYFVVRVGDAAAFRSALLERHRVLVRDCASFGMPEWVRIAARGGEEARRVVAGFADLAPALPAKAARKRKDA